MLQCCLVFGLLNATLHKLNSVAETLNNPKTVVWSHSDRQADFYELPTDGSDMNESLSWLLQYYDSVKLWMGVETDEGAELYLTCSPSKRQSVVNRLKTVEEQPSIFEVVAEGTPASKVVESAEASAAVNG